MCEIVNQLEKSTPAPLVALVTNINYIHATPPLFGAGMIKTNKLKLMFPLVNCSFCALIHKCQSQQMCVINFAFHNHCLLFICWYKQV